MIEAITSLWDFLLKWDWSALAGIVGTATGIISLVKVNRLKSLDLRMERGQLINTIQVKLDGLTDLCKKANSSRIHRFAAQGLSNSGSMEKWKNDYKDYENRIGIFLNRFSDLKNKKHPSRNLEKNILELHSVKEGVCSLIDNLEASIAEDDVAREQLSRMKFGNQNNTAAQ
jgi:hypothetical protein